jgi:hypothetical protein
MVYGCIAVTFDPSPPHACHISYANSKHFCFFASSILALAVGFPSVESDSYNCIQCMDQVPLLHLEP